MAQVITCDAHDQAHPADWLVTSLTNGEGQAYCNDAYRELMVGTVEAMNAAEADQAEAEANARIEAAGPAPVQATAEGDREYDQQSTDDALERRESTQPARIVGKGQSRKARQHRAKVAAQAERQAPTATLDGSSGPDDDEDDDEDAATAANGPDTETPQA